MAEDLGEAAAPSGHLVDAGLGPSAEVTRPESLDRAREGEVRRGVGIAEHHVRAGVHELPVDHLEGPPGDGHPDGRRLLECQPRREVRHPGRCLGLAVHDEEVPAAGLAHLGPVADLFGVEPTAGLGDVAQAREVHRAETHPLEELERVGDAGQRGGPRGPEQVPEALVDDREVGERDAGTPAQVRVHHGEPVAVVQREGCCCTVGFPDVQVGRDLVGVGREVVPGEPDELGRARRAAGAEQEGEVGVQLVRRSLPDDLECPAGADDDIRVVCRSERLARRLAVAGDEEHDVAPRKSPQVADQALEVVGPLDEHESSGRAEGLSHLVHAPGELGIGQRVVLRDHGERRAVGGEVAHPWQSARHPGEVAGQHSHRVIE